MAGTQGHTFQPNCTSPLTAVAYVYGPNIRGTLDIFWSSFATIIACTYTILHLNVPEQVDDRSSNNKRFDKHWVRSIRTHVLWAVLTFLMPEVILAKAIVDWRSAHTHLRALHKLDPTTERTWTLAHLFYANMGGYVLEYGHTAPAVASTDSVFLRNMRDPAPNQIDDFHDMDVERMPSYPDEVCHPSFRIHHLTALTLLYLMTSGHISTRQPLSRRALADRSKIDLLAKILAILQIGSFAVGIVARVIQGLLMTQMELGVAGLVVCALMTYTFSFEKPKAVDTIATVASYRFSIPHDIREAGRVKSMADYFNRRIFGVLRGSGGSAAACYRLSAVIESGMITCPRSRQVARPAQP